MLDDRIRMAVDDRRRRDDVAASGFEIIALPFPTLDALVRQDVEPQMHAAPGTDCAGRSQIGQRVLEESKEVEVIEVEYDQPGNITGDNGETGVSLLDEPAVEFVRRRSALLVLTPGEGGDLASDRNDAVATLQVAQGCVV